MKRLVICWALCLIALTQAYDTPPSITTQPVDWVGHERMSIVLNCEASAIPEPTYYWKKNGVLFNPYNNDTRASMNEGTLTITQPHTEDNGEYQCFANNYLGTALSNKVSANLAYQNFFKRQEPQTVNVDEGQPLFMLCGEIDGYPEPGVYWTDTAEKRAPIEYNERVNQDLQGNLVFSNVIPSDAKGYSCQATNHELRVSYTSPEITLTVNAEADVTPIGASLVTKPPASMVAIRTEPLTIKCIANGYPTPTIVWKRGGVQVVPGEGERVTIGTTGHELEIARVEYDDAGEYSCEASNDGGMDVATTVVSVDSAPYFSNPPSDETKGPGEEVTITCRADGSPSPVVDLLVSGQPWADFAASYETTGRWTVTTGVTNRASLTIIGLVTTDSNVFQCLATNKYTDVLTSVVLNVVSIPARIIRLTPPSGELIVMEQTSATFICHTEGRPTPTIVWTFKGTALTNGGKYEIDDVEGRLVINEAVEADSGDYECTATNNIDGETHTQTDVAVLEVIAMTMIVTPPSDLLVREGEDALFQCEVTYDPRVSKPEVYWTMGDQRLEANKDNSLQVANAEVSSSGTYTCVVNTTIDATTGVYHSTSSSAVLTVQGPPSPPQDLELLAQENEFVYRIVWRPGNDNNAPIQSFIIQYDTEWPDMHWVEKATVDAVEGTVDYIEVLHLDPYVSYEFRIIAVNEIGSSEPSESVAPPTRIAEAAPTRNPENPTGRSTDPRSMVIRWDEIHPYYYGGENFRYHVGYKLAEDKAGSFAFKDVYPPQTYLIVNASKPYEAYNFTVQSMNDMGEGPKAEYHIGYSGEGSPGAAPQGVEVDVISATEIDVRWQPISDADANGQLLGYNVYYNRRIASGQDKEQCPTSPCKVQGLQPFSTYEISVRAYTNGGEGPASDTITIETMEAPPGEVTLKVRAFSYRLVLDWQEPLFPNGVLEGYRVSIAPMTKGATEIGEVVNYTKTVDDELNLIVDAEPETMYRIQVYAINGLGEGDDATEEPVTLLAGRPAKPAEPKITGVGTDHANFTWDLSSINPTPSQVAVQYKKTGEDEYETSEVVDVLDDSEIMVSNLDATTPYMARLRVTNQAGSTISDAQEFKTTGTGAATDAGFVMGTWVIILICIIILLILILLIICIIKSQKGGKYNVSDKEKQLNKDIESTPLKDDGGFDEYKPPSDGEPMRGSQGSLNDSEHGSSETDSLKEYADGETGKFDEEGSFIGQYGDNKKQRQPEEGEGGAAYSTFV